MARRRRFGAALAALALSCGGTAVEEQPKQDTTSSAGGGSASSSGNVASSGIATTTNSSSVSASSGEPGGAGGVGGAGGANVAGSSTGGMPIDPWAGPVQSLAELDLGDVPLGTLQPFPIPDKTLGFTVLVAAPSLSEVVGIYQLRPPVGASVIFNYAMTGHMLQAFANQGFVAGADPQADSADAWPVKVGDWRIKLGDDDSSIPSGHTTVWVRRTNDGAFHGGVLDINVMIASGVSSTNYIDQVLAAFFPYVGLSIGTVTYFQMPAQYAFLDSYDEYRQMLEQSAGIGTAPALNLYVVGNFANAEFGGAIGVAAGIPGSAVEHGTPLSGVAYQPSGDAAYDATVLMHEIGHLGGLFHTSEFQIDEHDPLNDTASCTYAAINSNPNGCPDQNNVMFPIAYGATTFTQGQLNVLWGSALYRGILDAGGQPAPPLPPPPPPGGAGGGSTFSPIAAATSDAAIQVRRTARRVDAGSDPLARVLGSVWCDRAGDYEALAIQAAGPGGEARLRSIAADDKRADLVRARALAAYVRTAKAPKIALDLAASVAGDEAAPTTIRASALKAILSRDRTRARALAEKLATSPDAVMRGAADAARH